MRTLDLAAAAALGYGIWCLLRARERQTNRQTKHEALQTWEAEGGAVPTSPSTTAAQVSPAPDALAS